MRGDGHKLEHSRFPLNIMKHLFSCEGDQALAQIVQKHCRISLPGGIQKLSGLGPGQPALGGVLLEKETSTK